MLTFEEAARAADHLRAHHEIRRHPPAGLLALLILLAVSRWVPHEPDLPWIGAMAAGLCTLPWILRKLMIGGNLLTYRISLASYVLNGLLLGTLAFIELQALPWRPPEFLPEGLHVDLERLWPWVAVVLPVLYWILQGPAWKRRIQGYKDLVRAAKDRPDPVALGEVSARVAQALSSEPNREASWAEFRTVPATPRDWQRYFRLDTEEHGTWRTAFHDAFAVVVFQDGSRMEAVPRKGLKMVSEDPKPGTRWTLCLVRWNRHLHEGRITEDNLLKIHAWNSGSA